MTNHFHTHKVEVLLCETWPFKAGMPSSVFQLGLQTVRNMWKVVSFPRELFVSSVALQEKGRKKEEHFVQSFCCVDFIDQWL